MKFTTCIISLCIIFNVTLTGCSNVKSEPLTASNLFFDTLISISIYDSDADEALLEECFELCEKYEKLFSISESQSDISKINSSKGMPVYVSPETIKLIEDSVSYSKMTNGMFDVSVYTASKLWDFHNPDNEIPDENAIKNAIKHINYNSIIINDIDNTITLNDPELTIELGGIAKGYIADKIGEYLIENNVGSAIINIGGDMKIIGEKSENTPFSIGITNPNDTSTPLLGVNLKNTSIATSGTYERYIEKNGKLYHHILNPFSGYPVETDLQSVTIITNSSENADALCTCAILLGSLKSISLIESLNDTEAILIDKNNQIIKTSGIEKYIIN